jgi:hypothetical protein
MNTGLHRAEGQINRTESRTTSPAGGAPSPQGYIAIDGLTLPLSVFSNFYTYLLFSYPRRRKVEYHQVQTDMENAGSSGLVNGMKSKGRILRRRWAYDSQFLPKI